MFDLDKIIKHNIVKFVKNKKRENIDLRIRIKIVNILSKKQLVNRSRKNAINQKSKLNLSQFELDLFQANLSQSKSNYSNLFQIKLNFVEISLIDNQDNNQTNTSKRVQAIVEIYNNSIISKRKIQTFLHVFISKRKRDNNAKTLKKTL